MRFGAALSYLVLSAAAIASASAAEYKETDNVRPTRKRTLRATAANVNNDAEIVSALRAPANAPVAATAVGDSSASAIMTPQEEEDARLLRLDDVYYWKKFLGGDESIPDRCNFGVDIGCELKFAGGHKFRDCDDAFVCTSDITEQKFQYLGGGCAEEGATNARKYECKLYNDGPDVSGEVRVMVIYGDWWDAITSGAAATYEKARDRLNDLTDNRLNTITLLNRDNVKKDDIYELKDLGDPLGAPSDVDTDDLTYIVFEDGSNGRLLMKATWEWKCTGSNSGRYSIFDVFGNSELDGFDSERYGYVQPGLPRPQMQLTTTLENKCHNAEGMVAHLDRRLCYRDIGDSGYTCEPLPAYGPSLSGSAKLCVDQGQYAADADCVADGPLPGEGTNMVPFVIKPGGDIAFTDTYFDRLEIKEGREFQYRVPNATVFFKNDGGEYVQNLNTREEWFFGAGSPPAPTPTPGECQVDVSNIQCEVTTGNNQYRECEDIWKCTNDMTRQNFRYLGGGCKSEDFDSDVQYSCRTYDGGPGSSTRRVEIYQGDWYGIIEDNDSIQEVRNKISAQMASCNSGDVRLLDQVNVNEGTILNLGTFRTSGCLSSQDLEKLTYVVYQNDGNLGNADVRMKASWKWDCTPTGNDFFPMEAEYSVFDDFGNAELIFFASTQYGFVEEGMHTTRFQYTFENNCDAEGRIVEFDRQLCARECDDSKDDDWSCPSSAKSVCVANDLAANPPCTGSTILPASSSTTITDSYGLIPIGPDYEFQTRLLDITIEFNNAMTKTSDLEQEVFEFCANDSRAGTGGSGTGGGSGGGGAGGGGSGGGGSGGGGSGGGGSGGGGSGGGGSNKSNNRRTLAAPRGTRTAAKMTRQQARNGGRDEAEAAAAAAAARRNDWEENEFF